MYTPHVIAAAAFYFARKFTLTEVAKRSDGREWWEEYGVKIEQLRDAVMMMVEVYNALPHHTYHGKYPTSVVSPPEHHTERPRHNGLHSEDVDVEMKDSTSPSNNARATSKENTSPRNISSPKPAASQTESPKSTKRSPLRERGRSPSRASRSVDSYRPGDRSTSRGRIGRSRSRSKGRAAPSRGIDRYVPPPPQRGRDTYIPPPRSPRKRTNNENSPGQGREKRRRTPDEDISEGEIR
jgi:hypothetical protein